MENRQYLNFLIIAVHNVDDTVIAVDHFADCFIFDLGHHAAHTWKLLQRTNLLYHLFLEDLRKIGSADALVILNDGIKFALCLLSKTNFSHGRFVFSPSVVAIGGDA